MNSDHRMEVMNQLKNQVSTHTCPKCQGMAYCAMEDGKSGSACWCMSVSPREIKPDQTSCLCRRCLSEEK
jgi:hypothetical protein